MEQSLESFKVEENDELDDPCSEELEIRYPAHETTTEWTKLSGQTAKEWLLFAMETEYRWFPPQFPCWFLLGFLEHAYSRVGCMVARNHILLVIANNLIAYTLEYGTGNQ